MDGWAQPGRAASEKTSERLGRWAFPLLLALTLLFYFAPNLWLSLLALIPLALLIALRLDLALALVLAVLPFYLRPKTLGPIGLPLHELIIWLTLGIFILWQVAGGRLPRSQVASWQARTRPALPASPAHSLPPRSLDLPVLLFLAVAFFATLNAEHFGFALYDFRTVILTPVLYYWLLTRIYSERSLNLTTLSDALVLGALLISAIGLYQFFAGGVSLIEGVPRISSLYGSPNNLALYLGRVLPLLVAIAMLGEKPPPLALPRRPHPHRPGRLPHFFQRDCC